MYQLKQASINHLQDIYNLKNEIYKTNDDYNNLKFKLNTNYDENTYLGTLIYDKNKLICTYLTYSQIVSINGILFKALQAGDSMTDSNYLGQNLITHAGKETYKQAELFNFDAIFGFPLKNIIRTRLKCLNWKFGHNINSYNIFIPTLPIAYILIKINCKNIYFFYINFIINLFYKNGSLFQSSISANKNYDFIFRSSLYWKYKINNINKYVIKINNVNLILKFDKFLYIGDIDINAINNKFLFKIKLYLLAFLTFNVIIKTFCSPNTPLDNFLIKKFQSKLSLPFCYKNFTTKIDLKNLKFTYFDYDTF
jgi:hypothetical protein